MTAIYRIIKLGAPERGGADSPITAEIAGVAKTNDRARYTIANEVISEHVGRCLGLPIPAGILATDALGKIYFLSLDITVEQKALPPIIPADFVKAEPRIAAGCVAFDVLIANPDRHDQNLSLDSSRELPQPTLFDHGAALLGTGSPDGVPRLRGMTERLGCDGSPGHRHVLLDHLAEDSDLLAWVQRIEELPRWIFEDACERLAYEPSIALPETEKLELVDWLVDRARKLRPLIRSHSEQFPLVESWSLLWEEER